MPAQGKPQAQVVREAYFVQVPAPDGTVAFHDVTSQLGKPMPFTKPKATCAMQVSNVPVPRPAAAAAPAPDDLASILDPVVEVAEESSDPEPRLVVAWWRSLCSTSPRRLPPAWSKLL